MLLNIQAVSQRRAAAVVGAAVAAVAVGAGKQLTLFYFLYSVMINYA
jgi:hypothetical protein